MVSNSSPNYMTQEPKRKRENFRQSL